MHGAPAPDSCPNFDFLRSSRLLSSLDNHSGAVGVSTHELELCALFDIFVWLFNDSSLASSLKFLKKLNEIWLFIIRKDNAPTSVTCSVKQKNAEFENITSLSVEQYVIQITKKKTYALYEIERGIGYAER